MDSTNILSFLHILPQGVVLLACLYFVAKKVTTGGILLLTGSFISIIGGIAVQYFLITSSFDSMENRVKTMTFLGMVNFLSALIFAIGLFITVYEFVKLKNERAGILR